MTIAQERTRAVNQTYKFLEDLIDPKKTPRLPKMIRQRALSLLKHYPNSWDMEIAVKEGSSRFGDDKNPFGSKDIIDTVTKP